MKLLRFYTTCAGGDRSVEVAGNEINKNERGSSEKEAGFGGNL